MARHDARRLVGSTSRSSRLDERYRRNLLGKCCPHHSVKCSKDLRVVVAGRIAVSDPPLRSTELWPLASKLHLLKNRNGVVPSAIRKGFGYTRNVTSNVRRE